MHEYIIPTIHLRNRMGALRDGERPDSKSKEDLLPDKSYMPGVDPNYMNPNIP